MTVFSNDCELAAEIRSNVRESGVIGVDGWIGAGKTTLARALTTATHGIAIDLDCFLEKDQGNFVGALQLDRLSDALSKPSKLLFVSGICLRQALKLVASEAVAHIYVKRMATWGWADENDLLGKIAKNEGTSGGALRLELRAYHENWQPHLNADYEFHWIG